LTETLFCNIRIVEAEKTAMAKNIKAAVAGSGNMGSGVCRLLLEKKGIELTGVYVKRRQNAGRDLSSALGLNKKTGILLYGNLDELIKTKKPDILIQCTSSKAADAWPEIKTALKNGANVITIAEELSYPAYSTPEIAEKIETLALRNGVSVLGTGINPGYVLDYLVIALTGVCFNVDSIEASRVNDLSPYGYSVLKTQGVGLTTKQFYRGLEEGRVVGHFGFPQSVSMISKALGWKIDGIEQTRKPIVSNVERKTPEVTIHPGQTAGCEHTCTAYTKGKPVIRLIHPQQVHPELEGVKTGDRITIKGTPDISLSISPEIPGGIGTVALAVNMIPHVLNAEPGLFSMAEMPAPAALLGDIRELIK